MRLKPAILSSRFLDAAGPATWTRGTLDELRRAWKTRIAHRNLVGELQSIHPDLRKDQGLIEDPEQIARAALAGATT
jgi:hypothetical protein